MKGIRAKAVFIGIVILAGLVVAVLVQGRREECTVLRVNTYTMTHEELRSRMEEMFPGKVSEEEKEDFLEELITRKLILQEAVDLGLDRDHDFLRSVERFWEQALLKSTVDRKMAELSDLIQVPEDNIREHYEAWKTLNPESDETFEDRRPIIEKRLLRTEQSRVISEWIESLRKKANIDMDREKLFGPGR